MAKNRYRCTGSYCEHTDCREKALARYIRQHNTSGCKAIRVLRMARKSKLYTTVKCAICGFEGTENIPKADQGTKT